MGTEVVCCAERQRARDSYPVVEDCLHELHYSSQANRKSHKEASIWIGMVSSNASAKRLAAF